MSNGIQLSNRGLAAIFTVVFLFGGAVGYIVRDVRADDQVTAAASTARREVQETALGVMQRAEEAGATFAGGLSAAAESTKAAVGAVAAPRRQAPSAQPAQPDSTSGQLRDEAPKHPTH